jgi:hypothetical protein
VIKSSALENRAVTAPAGAEALHADIQRMKGKRQPEGDLAARLQAARALLPPKAETHCGHCFGEGRDAAIKMIEGA